MLSAAASLRMNSAKDLLFRKMQILRRPSAKLRTPQNDRTRAGGCNETPNSNLSLEVTPSPVFSGLREHLVVLRVATSAFCGRLGIEVPAMWKTGAICEESAMYSSRCCGAKLILGRSVMFPACERCETICEWSLELAELGSPMNGTPMPGGPVNKPARKK